tara:strand:- start:2256 stop:2423 length:168 start_codon:yes stop_codon:yes gene_type:complete
MDMKKAEEKWRKSCPDEVRGLVKRNSLPKRWRMKLEAHNNKKKTTRVFGRIKPTK